MRFVVLETIAGMQLVHETAAQLIPGYGSLGFLDDRADRKEQLTRLFDGHGEPPEASVVLAATDQFGNEVYGGAILEPTLSQSILTSDPHRARSIALTHWTLAALFVQPHLRGAGVGSRLLDDAAREVLERDGRYLDGFVDDVTGSVDFYRRAGATVTEHNSGLPRRSPTNTEFQHVAGYEGHWFYLDVWPLLAARGLIGCSRCRSILTFDPSGGGRLNCPSCPRPTGIA